jgi:hypothetical protein
MLLQNMFQVECFKFQVVGTRHGTSIFCLSQRAAKNYQLSIINYQLTCGELVEPQYYSLFIVHCLFASEPPPVAHRSSSPYLSATLQAGGHFRATVGSAGLYWLSLSQVSIAVSFLYPTDHSQPDTLPLLR